jgi:hypothetical protein
MSILIYFLFGIIAVLVVMLVGSFMPKKVTVEEKIIIQATPETIFVQVSDFRNFVKWSPWSEKDLEMKHFFSGEKQTIGSRYSWEGNRKVGKGYMEITALTPNKKVEMDLNFGPQGVAKCGFIIEPHSDSTELTWYFNSDMGKNPFFRLMAKMMDKFIRTDFRKGLINIATQYTQA